MMRTATVALMLGAGLTSCASFKKEQSGAELRKEGYEAILNTVKPGMYRRQLYAVLPPYKKPMARPPMLIDTKGFFLAHNERHMLDPECYFLIHYQPKDGNEYRKHKWNEPRSDIRSANKSIDGLLTEAIRKARGGDGSWAKFEFTRPEVLSEENPDDIILAISQVHLTTESEEPFWIEITRAPTQEVCWPSTTTGNDFPFVYPPRTPADLAGGKPKSVSDRPPLP